MVVIFGEPSDPCTSLTYQYLRRSGTTVALIDTSHFPATLGLNWPAGGAPDDGFLFLDDSRVALSGLSAVLARIPPILPRGPAAPAEDRSYVATELTATLLAFLNSLPCPVVNRPAHGVAGRSVAMRVEQARLIAGHGFKLPALLMTSSQESAARFFERHDRRALVGLPSGRHGWRRVAGEEGAGRLRALLDRGPVYLQELPPGQWLQVTTVGDRAFGATAGGELPGEEPDGRRLETVELPSAVQELCCGLARALDLELAQLQIVKNAAGELYCLDVSSWPALERYETPLQERIIASLGRLLGGGDLSVA